MTKEKDYFNTFCAVSRAFGTAATKNELLNLIVQSAIDTMNGKAACLFLADEKQNLFVPVAQKGLSENYLHANPVKAKSKIKALFKEGFAAYKDATSDVLSPEQADRSLELVLSLENLKDVSELMKIVTFPS